MIPLKDNIPSHRTPLVNYAVIAACSLAFLLQLLADDGGQRLVEQYGMVPVRLTDPGNPPVIEQAVQVQTPIGIMVAREQHALAPAAVSPLLTLVTCMFLHGGWMHFLGNMWFLYIFGDNVEDRLGHVGFSLLYAGTGIAAGLAHLASAPISPIPTIGASGAIAGVMGAYVWLYPRATVLAVVPIFVFLHFMVLPAPVFLGIWFMLQVFQGVGSLGGDAMTGVAWWAHVGGFVAGAGVAMLVGRAPPTDPYEDDRPPETLGVPLEH